jgi:hypothetical protein
MRVFILKLCVFFAPFVVVFGPAAFVLGISGEILSADQIALKQYEGTRDALYGAAYTNPDARYKLASARLRRPKLLAMGSSRALEFRGDLFTLRAGEFYNAGLLTERLHEMRRALAHLPLAEPRAGAATDEGARYILLGLDQWAFSPNWPNATDNPLYEREISEGSSSVLSSLQRSVRFVWMDIVAGRLQLAKLSAASENIGVNARLRGNGFRWDGSYYYATVLADPVGAKDYQFKESLKRIREATLKRYEAAADVSPAMIAELRLLLADAKRRQLQVVGYLPPYAPTVERAFRSGGKHEYIPKLERHIRPVFEEAGFPFFDFTSCERIGCTDAEFIDGAHPGVTTDARMILEMLPQVPWLDAIVDQDELSLRVQRSAGTPELVLPEAR